MDTTIRALALLAPRYSDLRYAIVGQGPERAALEALARREGVAERVRFLSQLGDEALPLAYALASVYVGASRQTAKDVEGFGIALLEAQAAGIPVVAGQSGGIPDAVQDGVTGVLTDPEDPAGVAAAIAGLLEDPVRARQFGAAGRASVERFFNWSRVVADLRAVSAEARSARR
jgi:phosphatidylinositol alpha-1,6-mannosyltransferase